MTNSVKKKQDRDSLGRFAKQTQNGSNGNEYSYDLIESFKLNIARDLRDNLHTINETLIRRTDLAKRWMDPRRSINDECGYPETSELNITDYKELYDRDPIAARVVDVLPQETWKINPYIFETEEIDNVTPFEQALKDLSAKIMTTGEMEEESWFEDDQSNPICEFLLRVDKLSGIGHFGLILLGVDDGKPLNEPLALDSKEKELLYLRTFDESLIDIIRYDEDRSSRRYGHPTAYNITLNDPYAHNEGAPIDTSTIEVHWTRVVHIADNLNSSEIFGVPRQRPVLNRLMDLVKLYGGSAEMFWKGAFPGFSLETHPELGGQVDLPSDIKDQIENWQNGLQRILAIAGTSIKSIAPQVADPSAHIDGQIDAICIKLGMPKRIFMGSERGKLASTQDESTWKDRLKARRELHVTPRLIVPFINRLIMAGVLPKPEQKYKVKWVDVDTLKPNEKADVSVKRSDAMTRYIKAQAWKLMSPLDFLHRELGYSREEAQEILDNREEDEMLNPEEPMMEGRPDVGKEGGIPAPTGPDSERMRADTTRMDGEGES